MPKQLYRVKCKKCNSTIAFKVEKDMEVKCDNCGDINTLNDQVQLELITQETNIQHLK